MPTPRENKGFWDRVESRYQPFGTTTILEDSRFAARFPVFVGFGSAANAFCIGVFVFALGEAAAGSVAVVTAAFYFGATIYYLSSGQAKHSIQIILWATVVNNVGLHIVLGGFAWSGVILGWGIVVTAASALLLSRRSTITIGGIYLVVAVAFAFFEVGLRASRPRPTVAISTVMSLDMFVVSLLILAPLTTLLVDQIAREQARANSLLLNVLPDVIAKRLKQSPKVIADEYEACTVLFADIVGFTEHSRTVTPERLVEELNHVFSRFDALAQSHGVEKIKTIGDGYMAVAGAPVANDAHVATMCDLAVEMRDQMPSVNKTLGTDFQIRIGINTGAVVAGVIGVSRFAYDLWGDTVNVASRMESQGEVGKIQVTRAVLEEAGSLYSFEPAGSVHVRGRGEMPVFILTGRR